MVCTGCDWARSIVCIGWSECYTVVPTAGVLQADPGVIREHDQIYRLFCHEAQRVFHDRLINREDKKYFYGILSEMASKHFAKVHTTP